MTNPNPERALTPTEEAFLGAGFPLDSDPADFYFEGVEHNVITHDPDGANVLPGQKTYTTFPIPKQFMVDDNPYALTSEYAVVSDRAVVEDSVLGVRAIVRPQARIKDSYVAKGVEVTERSTILDS